jgi:hypothetical protein
MLMCVMGPIFGEKWRFLSILIAKKVLPLLKDLNPSLLIQLLRQIDAQLVHKRHILL